MAPILHQQLLEALHWRYATKVFEAGRKLPEETWHALERALILSPSSFGLQPYRFIVVQDPELRHQLLPHSWNQRQVVDCSHYVVFAARTDFSTAEIDRFIQLTAETRSVSPATLAGYRRLMVGALIDHPLHAAVKDWASHQVYIALGNLMTSAAILGVDACPMEGFSAEHYDQLLNLPAQGYHAAVCCALGYRAATDKHSTLAKVRFSRDHLIQQIG